MAKPQVTADGAYFIKGSTIDDIGNAIKENSVKFHTYNSPAGSRSYAYSYRTDDDINIKSYSDNFDLEKLAKTVNSFDYYTFKIVNGSVSGLSLGKYWLPNTIGTYANGPRFGYKIPVKDLGTWNGYTMESEDRVFVPTFLFVIIAGFSYSVDLEYIANTQLNYYDWADSNSIYLNKQAKFIEKQSILPASFDSDNRYIYIPTNVSQNELNNIKAHVLVAGYYRPWTESED